MAKRSKQNDLNRYSGPRELCAWPNCDKQDDTFPTSRVGILCLDHAWSVHLAVREMRLDELTGFQFEAAINRLADDRAQVVKQNRLREQRGQQPGWVYYLRVGERVKIGYSADVKRRMRAYPPESRLLAVHPGTPQLETDMHRRFTGSRAAGREWFRETPDLSEHIEQVVAQFGEPTAHRYHFRTDATPLRRARSA